MSGNMTRWNDSDWIRQRAVKEMRKHGAMRGEEIVERLVDDDEALSSRGRVNLKAEIEKAMAGYSMVVKDPKGRYHLTG